MQVCGSRNTWKQFDKFMKMISDLQNSILVRNLNVRSTSATQWCQQIVPRWAQWYLSLFLHWLRLCSFPDPTCMQMEIVVMCSTIAVVSPEVPFTVSRAPFRKKGASCSRARALKPDAHYAWLCRAARRAGGRASRSCRSWLILSGDLIAASLSPNRDRAASNFTLQQGGTSSQIKIHSAWPSVKGSPFLLFRFSFYFIERCCFQCITLQSGALRWFEVNSHSKRRQAKYRLVTKRFLSVASPSVLKTVVT